MQFMEVFFLAAANRVIARQDPYRSELALRYNLASGRFRQFRSLESRRFGAGLASVESGLKAFVQVVNCVTGTRTERGVVPPGRVGSVVICNKAMLVVQILEFSF